MSIKEKVKRTGRNKFFLRDLLEEVKGIDRVTNADIITYKNTESSKFEILCKSVLHYFNNKKIGIDDLETQRRAIIGHIKDVEYYKDMIDEYLRINNLSKEEFPSWYSDLSSAIFHELWGLAGISEWYDAKTEVLKNSSSAKIVGNKIFFMINGEMKLMPQQISLDRRNQLKRALLSNDHRIRLDNVVPDIEMVTGERIKIFGEKVTRKGEDTIIFRKFPIKTYTFEHQIALGTYPMGIESFCKAIAKIGYNMVFTGAVRTSKTTQLTTWLSYEDPTQEGLIIETRPEIPVKAILPNSPIVSLVVDTEEKLEEIRSSIMRSDASYTILAEARDATSFDIALKSASVGTRRCKLTAHVNTPVDFPYEFASEITRKYGGNLINEALKVAKSYTLSLHFINLPKDKSKKRLEGIYVFEYDEDTYCIKIHTLCKYDGLKDDWSFNYSITNDMERIGKEENYEAFKTMCSELKKLSLAKPMGEVKVIKPFYSK